MGAKGKLSLFARDRSIDRSIDRSREFARLFDCEEGENSDKREREIFVKNSLLLFFEDFRKRTKRSGWFLFLLFSVFIRHKQLTLTFLFSLLFSTTHVLKKQKNSLSIRTQIVHHHLGSLHSHLSG
jgi:hypothetical protein